MVRIEGGVWKGRRLEVPDNKNLRPSSSKTKLSIFNILEAQRLKLGLDREFTDCRVVDLYAGVGSLGIEALSRGASVLTCVERDRLQLRAMHLNIDSLNISTRVFVIPRDVDNCWSELTARSPFDLAFLDPPYLQHGFVDGLPKLLPLMTEGAFIVVEHDPKLKLESLPGLVCQSTRVLGPAGISIFRKLS